MKMTASVRQLLKVITFVAATSWRLIENSSDFQNSKLDSLNEERTVIHHWTNDSQCSSFATRFAKNLTFPPTALVAFPGSGNTWLR